MKNLKKQLEQLLKDNKVNLSEVKLKYSKDGYGDKCVRAYSTLLYKAHRNSEAPKLSHTDFQFDSLKDAFVREVKKELERDKLFLNK